MMEKINLKAIDTLSPSQVVILIPFIDDKKDHCRIIYKEGDSIYVSVEVIKWCLTFKGYLSRELFILIS